MAPTTVIKTDQILVEYYPDRKIVHHTVLKPIGGQPLRDALLQGMEMFKKHDATKWLSDDRKNGPLPMEDAVWGATEWHPAMVKLGWKYWALVVPQEIVAAGTMTPVVESLHKLGVRVRVFVNLEEAFKWLDSVN